MERNATSPHPPGESPQARAMGEIVRAVVAGDRAQLARTLAGWPGVEACLGQAPFLDDVSLARRLLGLWTGVAELRKRTEWVLAGHLAAALVPAIAEGGTGPGEEGGQIRSLLGGVTRDAAVILTDAGQPKLVLASGARWLANLVSAGLGQDAS